MNQFKVRFIKCEAQFHNFQLLVFVFSFEQQSKVGSPTMANNPFLSSPSGGQEVDLFGGADPTAIQTQPTNAMDDLLQLGNPFADMFGAQPPAPVQQTNQWMNGKMKVQC